MYLNGTSVTSFKLALIHFLPLLLIKHNCSILFLLCFGWGLTFSLYLSIILSLCLSETIPSLSLSLSLRQIINTPTIPPVQSPFQTQPACSGKLLWRPGPRAGAVHDAYRRLRPQGYCPLNNGRKRPLSSSLYFSSFFTEILLILLFLLFLHPILATRSTLATTTTLQFLFFYLKIDNLHLQIFLRKKSCSRDKEGNLQNSTWHGSRLKTISSSLLLR